MDTVDNLHREVAVVLILVEVHNWDNLMGVLLRLVLMPRQPLLVSSSSTAGMLCDFLMVTQSHLDLEELSRSLAFSFWTFGELL